MARKTTLSAIGGWQSFLFCIGMYFVALFFSIFVCSSIFYVLNGRTPLKDNLVEKTANSKQVVASVNH
jgi:small-conductance mechanosensitive channel